MASPDSSAKWVPPWHQCHRFPAFRFSRIIIILLILVLVPLFTHYYLSKISGDSPVTEIHHKGIQMEDLESIKAIDLKGRIEEMIRIKVSVSDELRELESRRQKLQSDISKLTQRMEELKVDYTHQQVELDRLRISVEQAQYAQKEVQEKNTPHISSPIRILPSLQDEWYSPPLSARRIRNCHTHSCFDFSRCSLTSGFPVYFYHPDDTGFTSQQQQFLKSAITEALNVNVHITFDPAIACVYVVLVGEVSARSMEKHFQSLNHWNGDGRNHILLNLAVDASQASILSNVNSGRAIIAQPRFTSAEFRTEFDLIVPPLVDNEEEVHKSYLYSPARRKFLLSYQGEYRTSKLSLKGGFRRLSSFATLFEDSAGETLKLKTSTNISVSEAEDIIVTTLKEMQLSNLGDNFFFQFSCAGGSVPGLDSEWLLCGSHRSRLALLQDSTFSLLISPLDLNLMSTPQVHVRLQEALKTGAVPVVLGSQVHLPFDEFLDWKRAVIFLPKARISELHYYLRTFTDNDIIAMRHKGHLFYNRYFSSPRSVNNYLINSS